MFFIGCKYAAINGEGGVARVKCKSSTTPKRCPVPTIAEGTALRRSPPQRNDENEGALTKHRLSALWNLGISVLSKKHHHGFDKQPRQSLERILRHSGSKHQAIRLNKMLWSNLLIWGSLMSLSSHRYYRNTKTMLTKLYITLRPVPKKRSCDFSKL